MEEKNQGARVRRRRHSAQFKAEVVNACMPHGVSIAAIALRYQLNANMVRTWVSAHEGGRLTEQACTSASAPPAEFIPLQLTSAHAPVAVPDIVIEIRRGASTITVRWPQAAAADCASWLNGWLR
jgi:transposase-like protein